jgi:hypothetical protein
MNQGHLRMIPLQTTIPVREDSEVVIIYFTQINGYKWVVWLPFPNPNGCFSMFFLSASSTNGNLDHTKMRVENAGGALAHSCSEHPSKLAQHQLH